MDATPPPDVVTAPQAVASAAAPSPSRFRRAAEWFWRGRALGEAARSDDTTADPVLVRVALEAAEVADRLSSRIDPPRDGSGYASAIFLYRDALVAALLALGGTGTGREPSPENDAVLERLLTDGGTSAPDAVATARALLERDVAQVAALSDADRRDEAAAARRLVHGSIAVLGAARAKRRRVLSQRVVRMGFLTVLLSVLVVGAVLLANRLNRHPNLLEQATMRTSSNYPGFNLADHICDGKKTRIIFHTNREEQPWVVFDLGAARTVKNIELWNRRDCCEDRALPLVVEFSPDGNKWTEVLRRSEPFGELRQKVPPTSVRMVRVKALKKTWFHLERVAVW